MTNSNFKKRRNNENYYKQAKDINVRARSYFKLEQLDLKYKIINDDMKILDLGSAPGAWIEYVASKTKNSKIVGIDLLEIKDKDEFSENVEILEDDFNNLEEYNLGEFDLVLSDMAPEFSGDSTLDKGKTHKLNLETIKFCSKYLKKSGNLLFKSFEGEDLPYVRTKAKELFYNVKEFKPKSSQKKSAEVFIICFKRK